MLSNRKEVKLDDTTLDVVKLMAEDNVGALSVCGQILREEKEQGVFTVLNLDDMNMRGVQIWIAFSEFCNRDLKRFIQCVKDRNVEMVALVNKVGQAGMYDEIAVIHGASSPMCRKTLNPARKS